MSKNKKWVIRHETHIIMDGEFLTLCGLDRDSMTSRDESQRVMRNMNPRPEEEDFGCVKCLLLLNEQWEETCAEVTEVYELLGGFTPEELVKVIAFNRAIIDGDIAAVIKALREDDVQSTEGDAPTKADEKKATKQGKSKGGAA